MKLKVSIIFLFSFCLTIALYGQNVTITGIVNNVFNNPIEDVAVKHSKGDEVVYTDSLGQFSIDVPESGRLLFLKSRYEIKKVPVKGNDNIVISLDYDLQNTDEKMINTGYGQIKRSESTISTGSVDPKLLEREQTLDLASFLRTVPGVNVVERDGDINILIRGNRSLMASDSPLIMLNGSQYNGPLKNLNPMDIKAIDVLKDGAATAAYGSRGANGVVLITTK